MDILQSTNTLHHYWLMNTTPIPLWSGMGIFSKKLHVRTHGKQHREDRACIFHRRQNKNSFAVSFPLATRMQGFQDARSESRMLWGVWFPGGLNLPCENSDQAECRALLLLTVLTTFFTNHQCTLFIFGLLDSP